MQVKKTMTIIKFGEIVCQDTNTVLHVRICRMINWEKTESDQPDGFQFVLVDKEVCKKST